MTETTALDKQIERYRQMTGEQRHGVALELHEMSCDIAREGIRRQNPKAGVAEVEQFLHDRIKSEREIKNKNERLISYHVQAPLGAKSL